MAVALTVTMRQVGGGRRGEEGLTLAVFVKGRTTLQQDLAKRKAHDCLAVLLLGRKKDPLWHRGVANSTRVLFSAPPSELVSMRPIGCLVLGKGSCFGEESLASEVLPMICGMCQPNAWDSRLIAGGASDVRSFAREVAPQGVSGKTSSASAVVCATEMDALQFYARA